MALVNALRARGATCGSQTFGPAPALTANGRLTQAARDHSADMAARNVFSHTGAGGSTVGQRATAAGYAWSSVAENIAAGYPTVARVVDSWATSPGHCANLMAASLSEAGLACVSGSASTDYSTYWTMLLGRPR
jgi:uncharacterized protein YkwD